MLLRNFMWGIKRCESNETHFGILIDLVTVHQYIYVMIRSPHTNQYSSILYFCSCVAFHCSYVNPLYSNYILAKGGHAAWVPCEIWGESCK